MSDVVKLDPELKKEITRPSILYYHSKSAWRGIPKHGQFRRFAG